MGQPETLAGFWSPTLDRRQWKVEVEMEKERRREKDRKREGRGGFGKEPDSGQEQGPTVSS